MSAFARKWIETWTEGRSLQGKSRLRSRRLQAEVLESRWLLSASTGSDPFFAVVDEMPAASRPDAVAYTQPARFASLTVDGPSLRAELATAPQEGGAAAANPLILNLPTPDGSFSRFAVVESSVMSEGLRVSFPGIRTYLGQGLDDPTATLRADFTSLGFHAQVLSPQGSWYIDPYWHLDQSAYISYYRADLGTPPQFEEHMDDLQINEEGMGEGSGGGGGPEALVTRRDVRTVVSTTTAYNSFFGGTVNNVLSAVTTAINRITGVYEVDSAIRLILQTSTTFLFSGLSGAGTSNPNPTLAGGSNVSSLGNNNQAFTDGQVGASNYDLGHVFHRGSFNGISVGGIGIVGRPGVKARAATSGTPSGDVFYIDYVAHEMGHQFGGRHNFNNCSGGLGDSAAFSNEPASGSTIMGYAGICSINVQPNSSAYFNYINLNQISAYMASGQPQGMPAPVVTANNTPVINSLTNFNIPDQTPFRLQASGSDIDGDALTFTWEQADTGGVNSNPSIDPGSGPIIRSRTGTASGERIIPPLANILVGNNSFPTGEILPMTTRTLNFRVTARDHRAGEGGVAQASMQIFSHNLGTGFLVTSPNSAVSWAGGSTQTVTWNVSGTNAAPINTANVRILLSTDGGQTFPFVLAESTPNTGSATVQMPLGVGTTTARIMVEARDNIYFDISNPNFTITQVTDVDPPTAVGSASDVTTGGGTSHEVTVEYSDNTAINASTIGDDDILIQLPDTSTVPVTLVSTSSNTNTTPITAVYSFVAPGGVWDPSDNGVYEIVTVAGAVTDAASNPIAGGPVGSFNVNVTSLPGDFNGDNQLDCADVNELSDAIANASSNLLYDVNNDSLVNVADLQYWVEDLKLTLVGDANLDFVVDGSDFNLWNQNKFTSSTEWCLGNFNADFVIDGSDFNLWNMNKFQAARPPADPASIQFARALATDEGSVRRLHFPPPAIRMSDRDVRPSDSRDDLADQPPVALRPGGGNATQIQFTRQSADEPTRTREDCLWDAIFEDWS